MPEAIGLSGSKGSEMMLPRARYPVGEQSKFGARGARNHDRRVILTFFVVKELRWRFVVTPFTRSSVVGVP